MNRLQLTGALGLGDDASAAAIRSAAARRASGDRRLGSSDVARAAFALQLGLRRDASTIALLRVTESIISRPLGRAPVTSILAPTHRRTTA